MLLRKHLFLTGERWPGSIHLPSLGQGGPGYSYLCPFLNIGQSHFHGRDNAGFSDNSRILCIFPWQPQQQLCDCANPFPLDALEEQEQGSGSLTDVLSRVVGAGRAAAWPNAAGADRASWEVGDIIFIPIPRSNPQRFYRLFSPNGIKAH